MTQKVHGGIFYNAKRESERLLVNNVGGIGFVSNERSRENLKMEQLKN